MNDSTTKYFDFSKDDLSSPAQIAFLEYWKNIKGDKPMPSRVDFDPMKISVSLPHIIVNDVTNDPLRFKMRLIGSKCNIPASYLGKYIDEIPEMTLAIKMLTNCYEIKKPYFYFSSNALNRAIERCCSTLVLPFSQDGTEVNILMACDCLID